MEKQLEECEWIMEEDNVTYFNVMDQILKTLANREIDTDK